MILGKSGLGNSVLDLVCVCGKECVCVILGKPCVGTLVGRSSVFVILGKPCVGKLVLDLLCV